MPKAYWEDQPSGQDWPEYMALDPQRDNRCGFEWYPRKWPFITRCNLDSGHEGPHFNMKGDQA